MQIGLVGIHLEMDYMNFNHYIMGILYGDHAILYDGMNHLSKHPNAAKALEEKLIANDYKHIHFISKNHFAGQICSMSQLVTAFLMIIHGVDDVLVKLDESEGRHINSTFIVSTALRIMIALHRGGRIKPPDSKHANLSFLTLLRRDEEGKNHEEELEDALMAVRADGMTLKYLNSQWRNNRDVAAAAIEQNTQSWRFVSDNLRPYLWSQYYDLISAR